MTKIEKIEEEIRRLDRDELADLRNWFREYYADEWDREIEDDIRAGKLDKLAEEALVEHRAGKSKQL